MRLAIASFAIVGSVGILLCLSSTKGRHDLKQNSSIIAKPDDGAKTPPAFTNRFANMSAAERDAFTNMFNSKMKPAIERWCGVYQGRVPFTAKEVGPEQFHSIVNGNNYTFMIQDTTLTVRHSDKETRVVYLMTRQAARQLNSTASGSPPDLSRSVSRETIFALIEADTGLPYPSTQVQIVPTGGFSDLRGGVSVEAGGITGNGVYRAISPTNLDFVLGADGKLVYYLR